MREGIIEMISMDNGVIHVIRSEEGSDSSLTETHILRYCLFQICAICGVGELSFERGVGG